VTYPREVLNELRWKPGMSLAEAEITYVHRGAPKDEMTIRGSDIMELERSFFVTRESKIPYHRIKRIVSEGKVLFDIHGVKMDKDD
jgi:uncharacterized protein (UPF0248 family)